MTRFAGQSWEVDAFPLLGNIRPAVYLKRIGNSNLHRVLNFSNLRTFAVAAYPPTCAPSYVTGREVLLGSHSSLPWEWLYGCAKKSERAARALSVYRFQTVAGPAIGFALMVGTVLLAAIAGWLHG